MKAKNFWYLKTIPERTEPTLHIVDGNGDIICNVSGMAEEDIEYFFFQEICNAHNLSHLEDRL